MTAAKGGPKDGAKTPAKKPQAKKPAEGGAAKIDMPKTAPPMHAKAAPAKKPQAKVISGKTVTVPCD